MTAKLGFWLMVLTIVVVGAIFGYWKIGYGYHDRAYRDAHTYPNAVIYIAQFPYFLGVLLGYPRMMAADPNVLGYLFAVEVAGVISVVVVSLLTCLAIMWFDQFVRWYARRI